MSMRQRRGNTIKEGYPEFFYNTHDDGHLKGGYIEEEITVSTDAYTDSTAQIPANSLVIAISAIVTTNIPGSTATIDIDPSGCSSGTYLTLDEDTGSQSMAGGIYVTGSSAESIRVTPDAAPSGATGKVKVIAYYFTLGVATS